MERILEKYINKETGVVCVKRLFVKKIGELFHVVRETDRGWGEGFVGAPLCGIKPYKTEKGAEKAMQNWQPEHYRMSLVEGLMQEGKI